MDYLEIFNISKNLLINYSLYINYLITMQSLCITIYNYMTMINIKY